MLRQRSGAAAALWRIHTVQDPSAVARQHRQFSTLPDSVLYEDDQHRIRDCLLPRPVWDCLHQLRVAGHEVFLVGGAVRDLLLQSQEPKDFDLLTSAQLQKVKELFQHHKPRVIGRNFPICQLEVRGHKVEISSMHTRPAVKPWSPAAAPVSVPADVAEHLLGSSTAPGRGRRSSILPHMAHQQQQPLSWAAAKRANAAARDFTANALLYDPFQRVLYDYVGGVTDIWAQQLRCVGNAVVRFQADPACLLRAVRCAARAGLRFEAATLSALQSQGHLVTSLNVQRITAEIIAMLAYGAAAASLSLLQQTQLMQHVLPVHHQHLQRWQQQQSEQLRTAQISSSGPNMSTHSACSNQVFKDTGTSHQASARAGAGQPSADSSLGQMLHGLAGEQKGLQQQQQPFPHEQPATHFSYQQFPSAPASKPPQEGGHLQQALAQRQSLLARVAAALDQQVSVTAPASAEVILACLTAPLVVEVMWHAVQQLQLYYQQQQQEGGLLADGALDSQLVPQPPTDRSGGSSNGSSSSGIDHDVWPTQILEVGPRTTFLHHPSPAGTAATATARSYSTGAGSSGVKLCPVSQQLLSGACLRSVVLEQAVTLATQVCSMSGGEYAGSTGSSGVLFGIHTPQLAAGMLAIHLDVCKHMRLLRAHAHTAAAAVTGRAGTRKGHAAGRQQPQWHITGTRHQQTSHDWPNSSSGKGVRSLSSTVQSTEKQQLKYTKYEQFYPRTNKQYRRLMEQQRQAAAQHLSHAGDLEVIASHKAMLTAAAEAVFGDDEGSLNGVEKCWTSRKYQHKPTASLIAGVTLDHQEHLVHQTDNCVTQTLQRMASNELESTAQEVLRDCCRYALFDASGLILATNYQPAPMELQALTKVLEDRENAIRSGMVIDGQRYEVHRFHPPLAYGRTMGCAPESSIGAALCAVDKGITGQPCYGVITYAMPNLSARMVPILQQLCEQQLRAS